jgi:RNA polymerase sigma-70 factor (ECF subfamily)
VYDNQTGYTKLLERLKASDLEAFGELYVQVRERLFVYALSFLKDEDISQDLVQEMFVDLWENRQFEHIHSDLIGYLVRTVRNRSLTYIRQQQNQARLRNEHFGTGESLTEPDTIEAWALGEEIEAAIARLPPMAAKVFRLHYIEKLSYAEIADQLQISVNTVGNHIARALKGLRGNLKKN